MKPSVFFVGAVVVLWLTKTGRLTRLVYELTHDSPVPLSKK